MLTDTNNPLSSLLPWEEPPVVVDLVPVESLPARPLPEMPFSINTFITVKGRRCQVTVRSVDDNAGLARFEAILDRYPVDDVVPVQETAAPRPTAAPAATVEDTPAVPEAPVPAQEPASRDDWCAFHQEQMRHNERGWYHQPAPGVSCNGHWCTEHHTKYWENISKRDGSVYYSHKREDGNGYCYEKKRARV